MSRYSYELGSDGFDSPGSSVFGKPGFNFLPYGVHTPDSLMSTGSREIMSASYMGKSNYEFKLSPLEGNHLNISHSIFCPNDYRPLLLALEKLVK